MTMEINQEKGYDDGSSGQTTGNVYQGTNRPKGSRIRLKHFQGPTITVHANQCDEEMNVNSQCIATKIIMRSIN